MKKISESKRFLISIGKARGKECFFVAHKSFKFPKPVEPVDLARFLIDVSKKIK